MESIISCILKDSNICYTLNRDIKGISLTHPLLYKYLHENNTDCPEKEQDMYYNKKYDYLKNHGYTNDRNINYQGKLSEEQVKEYISNIRQVVFEVTDACNLKCKYCGYGEFYGSHDIRKKNMMKLGIAQNIIKHLKDVWESNQNTSLNELIYISFYGGEPLLNIPFIADIINDIKSLSIKGHTFNYTMTTNAILLDKYMDFLVSHSFKILISLDGDAYNNSYRITQNGNSSFARIIRNIKLLQQTHPDYFNENVNFNAVLHNRNSVNSIFNFIHSNFDKTPNISELNLTGIKSDKKDEFSKLYKNTEESLYNGEKSRELEKQLFMHTPAYHSAATFLHKYNHEAITSYSDFFYKPSKINYLPTGTCMPFERKIFITVNGKILPCERIGHQYSLGLVTESNVHLNAHDIAEKYNGYFEKFKQCNHCYRSGICTQCMFNLDELDNKEFNCISFMSKYDFTEYFGRNMLFLETHREDYKKLMQVHLE